jgi:transcriptional regulator with XRE-family HTH domain
LVIGDNVSRLRREKRWTQKKLAELTGLSCKYIEDIEEGRHCPSVKALAIIARALGVEIEEIIKGSGG